MTARVRRSAFGEHRVEQARLLNELGGRGFLASFYENAGEDDERTEAIKGRVVTARRLAAHQRADDDRSREAMRA